MKNTIKLVMYCAFTFNLLVSAKFYYQLQESKEMIQVLQSENNRFRTHIDFLQYEINLKEVEIVKLNNKCDSLKIESNNKRK